MYRRDVKKGRAAGNHATQIIVMLLFLLAFLPGEPILASEADAPNLVRNGGFEELTSDDHPAEWRLRIEGEGYSVRVLEGVGIDGGQVVQLSGTQSVNGRAHVMQRDIPINEYRGKTVVLRGWYKGENVYASSHFLNVEFLNEEQNRLIAPTVSILPPLGTTDWTLFEKEVLIPDDAYYVWINANLLNGTGTIWWDNIELREGSLDTELLPMNGNLLYNPTFIGAERQMPPPGWALYGNLANGHRIELLHHDVPERRALLIEDLVSIPRGNEGEIGLTQMVGAEPGRLYVLTATAAALPGEPSSGVYLQLRFIPSNELRQIELSPAAEEFLEFSTELVAPEGTHAARVYLYTSAAEQPKILLQSIRLTEVSE